MADPLSDIENRKAQLDLGVAAYRIFEGAISEGASFIEAYMIAVAWFDGMFRSSRTDYEEGGDEKSQD